MGLGLNGGLGDPAANPESGILNDEDYLVRLPMARRKIKALVTSRGSPLERAIRRNTLKYTACHNQ